MIADSPTPLDASEPTAATDAALPAVPDALPNGVDLWSVFILLAGIVVALDSARCHSPTYDETLHVVSGLCYWEHGRWDVYPQNPPLVKLCLAAPLVLSGVEIPSEWLGPRPAEVHRLGNLFHNRHRDNFDRLYFRCRVVSILFYAWGAWLIGRWAGELFGVAARRGTMALWCFQPLVLAHASVATPDIGAAVIALSALRALSRQLQGPSWRNTVRLGLWIGAAQASKFTLVMIYPFFGVIALLVIAQTAVTLREVRNRIGALLVAYSISLIPLAAAYGFQGLGQPLKAARFSSPTLRGVQSCVGGTPLAWGARLVPSHFLYGFDLQAVDVDGRWVNYFRGHESNTGWVAYYPTALALKTPVLFWLVVVLAFRAGRTAPGHANDEMCLVVFPLLLFLFLWSNTSLTFLRYLLPCYPPAFVWLGRAFAGVQGRRQLSAALCATATVMAALSQHPHYLGYFNALSGGPPACWRVFSDGEIDWGQDLPALAKWQTKHPEAMPMRLALFAPYSPPYSRLSDAAEPPHWNDEFFNSVDQIPQEPHVGTFAISVSLLNRGIATREHPHQRFARVERYLAWVAQRQPVALVGTSILIYRITSEDVLEWPITD